MRGASVQPSSLGFNGLERRSLKSARLLHLGRRGSVRTLIAALAHELVFVPAADAAGFVVHVLVHLERLRPIGSPKQISPMDYEHLARHEMPGVR